MPSAFGVRKCAYCEVKLEPNRIEKYCPKIECRMAWQKDKMAETGKYWSDKKDKLDQQKKTVKDQVVKQMDLDPNDVLVVETPHYPQKPEPIDEERILAYTEHLQELVNSLGDVESETKFKSSFKTSKHDFGSTIGTMCAMCNGKCCHQGFDRHAFIQRSTVLKVLEKNDELRSEDIVELYLGYIPEKAMGASCIYHTEVGCCLPREFQADICGEYYCQNLSEYINVCVDDGEPGHNIVFAARDHEVDSIRLVERGGKSQPLDIDE